MKADMRLRPGLPGRIMNWNINVQRELPLGFLADVAYVGNAGRNQPVKDALLALRSGDFLFSEMVRDGGPAEGLRVMRSYKDGATRIGGFRMPGRR